MVYLNGVKLACSTCVKGHRSSACQHPHRPLFEIKKKGRPVTQCMTCRELRKTKQVHIKCMCRDQIKESNDALRAYPSLPDGLEDLVKFGHVRLVGANHQYVTVDYLESAPEMISKLEGGALPKKLPLARKKTVKKIRDSKDKVGLLDAKKSKPFKRKPESTAGAKSKKVKLPKKTTNASSPMPSLVLNSANVPTLIQLSAPHMQHGMEAESQHLDRIYTHHIIPADEGHLPPSTESSLFSTYSLTEATLSDMMVNNIFATVDAGIHPVDLSEESPSSIIPSSPGSLIEDVPSPQESIYSVKTQDDMDNDTTLYSIDNVHRHSSHALALTDLHKTSDEDLMQLIYSEFQDTGGGLPVGTVLLVKEDKFTSYAQLLLKYYFAQGLAHQQHVLIASKEEAPSDFIRNLMWLAEGEETEAEKKEGDEAMKIAWRYQNLKQFGTGIGERPPSPVPTSLSSKSRQAADLLDAGKPKNQFTQGPFCHTFDLTKRPPTDIIEPLLNSSSSTTFLDLRTSWDAPTQGTTDDYKTLLDTIQQTVQQGGFSSLDAIPSTQERKVLRVGVQAIAGPTWSNDHPNSLLQFLHALRGLLRFSFGAAMITIPAHLYNDDIAIIRRVEHLCDAVVEVESFAGSPEHTSAAYSATYHGLFYVHKLPVLNSLLASSTKLSVLSAGGSNNLAFKLRRKKFSIETFHLPPEGGVGERRTAPASEPREKQSKSKETGTSSSQHTSPLRKLAPGFSKASMRLHWPLIASLLALSEASTDGRIKHQKRALSTTHIAILSEYPTDAFLANLTSSISHPEGQSVDDVRIAAKSAILTPEVLSIGNKTHILIWNLSDADAQYLAQHDMINNIELNAPVSIQDNWKASIPTSSDPKVMLTQSNPPSWGLCRINERTLPLANEFSYIASSGQGVDVYVIDTGIFIEHEDFGGRAVWGKTAIEGAPHQDDNGHGTFVSGIIGGSVYGVAKQCNLIAVKALDATGGGTISDILHAIQYVYNSYVSRGTKKAIANLSIGTEKSNALNAAVNALVDAGIMVTVAAGNGDAEGIGDDACQYSPSSASSAISVGAIAPDDTIAPFSNYGSCVSLYAPGVEVTSDWIDSAVATHNLSGTSFSSPYVAGTLALMMGTLNGKDISFITMSLVRPSFDQPVSSLAGVDPVISELQSQFSRIMQDVLGDFDILPASRTTGKVKSGEDQWIPALDVYEDEKGYHILAEVPGAKKENVKVEMLDNSTLQISGEVKCEKEDTKQGVLWKERRYGKFLRRIPLPSDAKADGICAKFEDGVLKICVPKTEKPKPKEIPVN
ncbi:hypothetical protein BZG36_05076 [Bifiguratus adelaidae]|uniref:Elongator complex protein 4 n=1 Tax=Bifiguratus adelaidae TaxID=1938954 RepID=A0A261XTU3_9FUNG|nr:hypothetical protein BZG36_05076 [Bifiguratus adelaidae]